MHFADHVTVVLSKLFLVLGGGHDFTWFECPEALFLLGCFVLLSHPFIIGLDFIRFGFVPGLVDCILGVCLFGIFLVTEHGGGRKEAASQGPATPGGLDQQNLLLIVITHHVAKIELRAKAFPGCPIANGQVTMLAEVIDPDILARAPQVGRRFPFIVGVSGLGYFLRERLVVAILDEVSVTLPVFFL